MHKEMGADFIVTNYKNEGILRDKSNSYFKLILILGSSSIFIRLLLILSHFNAGFVFSTL